MTMFGAIAKGDFDEIVKEDDFVADFVFFQEVNLQYAEITGEALEVLKKELSIAKIHRSNKRMQARGFLI